MKIRKSICGTHRGFTIVELVIVIIVIGILASIVLVSYSAVIDRSQISKLKADILTTAQRAGTIKTTNSPNIYPSTLSQINGPANPLLNYKYFSQTDTYCLSGTYKTTSYYITNYMKQPDTGVCNSGGFIDVSVSWAYSCGITYNTRQLYCWGMNDYGQLGNGTTTNSSTPVAVNTSVIGSDMIAQVTTGEKFACALGVSGNVYCWGENSYGELGNGSSTNSSVPVLINTSLMSGTKTFKKIDAGNWHACGISTDNRLYCWGMNKNGEQGNGQASGSSGPTSYDVHTPTQVQGALSGKTVSDVGLGIFKSCALVAMGTATQEYCWGWNGYGQVGDGTTTEQHYPTAIVQGGMPSLTNMSSIAYGMQFSCAIDTNAHVFCWGDNTWGVTGTASASSVLTPSLRGGSLSFKKISGGGSEVCGVTTTGVPYCWGSNQSGQLGVATNYNTTTKNTTPVALDLSSLDASKQYMITIDAGADTDCMVNTLYQLYCVGSDVGTYVPKQIMLSSGQF